MRARAGPAGGRGGGADGGSIPRGLGVRPARPAGLCGSSGWTSGYGGVPERPVAYSRPTDLSERTPEWSEGAQEEKDLEVGRVVVTPPGGRLRRPVFPLGDASSAPRLRVPGSRGWEPVRRACRAAGASRCARTGGCLCRPVLAMHPTQWLKRFVSRLKKKKKTSRRMGCPPGRDIHGNYHDVQFESIPTIPFNTQSIVLRAVLHVIGSQISIAR